MPQKAFARPEQGAPSSGSKGFPCNICGADVDMSKRGRDALSCPGCNSTARTRAVVRVLSNALFGEVMPLADFPSNPELVGIGMSDWGYDRALAEKFNYTNTFYDREPRLDITDPPARLEGTCDFLISSDVFEHVEPPVQRAFEAAYRLLKPTGVLVLTVPYLTSGDSREHFPSLQDYEILDFKGEKILVNRTNEGWEVFDNLNFHWDGQDVLEMRILSWDALVDHLKRAGFADITDCRSLVDECWDSPHSFPLTARSP